MWRGLGGRRRPSGSRLQDGPGKLPPIAGEGQLGRAMRRVGAAVSTPSQRRPGLWPGPPPPWSRQHPRVPTAAARDRGSGERGGEKPGPAVYRAQRRAASRARRLRPTASISLHGAVRRGRSWPPRVREVLGLCARRLRRPPRGGSGRRGPPGSSGGSRPRSLGNGGGDGAGDGRAGRPRAGAGEGAGEEQAAPGAHRRVTNPATCQHQLLKLPS